MAAAKKKKPPRPAATKTAAKKPAAPAIAKEPPKPVAVAPKKSTPVKPAAPPPPPPRPAALPAGGATSAPAAAPVDPAARVAALWQRLEAWVAAAGAPPLELNPPASEKAIKAAEKEMGLAFPADFRASLRLHDGQASNASGDARSFPWLPGCPPLAPLEKLVAEHAREQKLAARAKIKPDATSSNPRLKPGIYRAGRIPIAGTPRWDGDTTFIDLDPGPAGAPGQVIITVGGGDPVVIDSSFAAALERWVNVLERGLWVYDAEHRAVHPRALTPHIGNPAGWFSKR